MEIGHVHELADVGQAEAKMRGEPRCGAHQGVGESSDFLDLRHFGFVFHVLSMPKFFDAGKTYYKFL